MPCNSCLRNSAECGPKTFTRETTSWAPYHTNPALNDPPLRRNPRSGVAIGSSSVNQPFLSGYTGSSTEQDLSGNLDQLPLSQIVLRLESQNPNMNAQQIFQLTANIFQSRQPNPSQSFPSVSTQVFQGDSNDPSSYSSQLQTPHAGTTPASYTSSSFSEGRGNRRHQPGAQFLQAPSPLAGPPNPNNTSRRPSSLFSREPTESSRHSLSPHRNVPGEVETPTAPTGSSSRLGFLSDPPAPAPAPPNNQGP